MNREWNPNVDREGYLGANKLSGHHQDLRSLETKERILVVSRSLFSRFGFEGTSIREIAKHSQVNVAAVNYHFKNKETLFWSIILDSHRRTEGVLRELAARTKDSMALAMLVFDYFLEQKEVVRNTMKLILSEGLTPPENSEVAERLNCSYGPPGGQYLAEKIQSEVSFPLSEEGQIWGVKVIFGSIVYWTSMCATSRIKQLACHRPLLKPEQIRRDVAHIVASTLAYLDMHPQLFQAKTE